MHRLVLILCSTLVLSAAASIDSKAEKDVLAAMDAYKEAMTHKDGAALEKLTALGATHCLVSISHQGDYAVAFAIIE